MGSGTNSASLASRQAVQARHNSLSSSTNSAALGTKTVKKIPNMKKWCKNLPSCLKGCADMFPCHSSLSSSSNSAALGTKTVKKIPNLKKWCKPCPDP
eukprot:gene31494-6681_t